MVEDFKRRFWISLIVTMPVLILSPMIQSFLGYSLTFAGRGFVLLAMSGFVYGYGGWPFLTGLVSELRKGRPGMMTLIALAMSVAFLYSGLVVLGVQGKVFFWELVTLIDVMLLGHWVEMRSVMGASNALHALLEVMPRTAHRLDADGRVEDVDIEVLEKGDRVQVKPGERIPADGSVLDGRSDIDFSMVTGESEPVPVGESDLVIGGSVNGTGSITVRVEQAGEESYLSRMVGMVREAAQSKSKAQNIADKAALWLTVVALTAGAVTFAAWLALDRETVFALERTVTVMVITCPHALGLAVPLVIAVITSLSARNGLLIRNRTPFEEIRSVDVVVFDKTGTLTTGEFAVTDVVSVGDWDADRLLTTAAAVESVSEHSIGAGIVAETEDRGLDIESPQGFEALPGRGAKALVSGSEVLVGNHGILEEAGLKAGSFSEQAEKISSQGRTVVFVATDGALRGLIGLADTVRERSAEAIRSLRSRGLEIALITGDNERTARSVAEELGVDDWFAEVLPDRKSERIAELQSRGKKVAMVGDGVNDAPALARADVGIAIGAGTDIAAETADLVLVDNDPMGVEHAVALSTETRRKMVQNLAWATGYNVVAIPLAAGVLLPWRLVLPPAVGALVMSLSTIIVAVNARLVSVPGLRSPT
ncbi:cadmium-translocating P-type ATPase [Candidatus Fermentibacteria bacterium]|nr:cadmium-translocating P-type ATPase [Candidatus Fermentibacteria bacterium]